MRFGKKGIWAILSKESYKLIHMELNLKCSLQATQFFFLLHNFSFFLSFAQFCFFFFFFVFYFFVFVFFVNKRDCNLNYFILTSFDLLKAIWIFMWRSSYNPPIQGSKEGKLTKRVWYLLVPWLILNKKAQAQNWLSKDKNQGRLFTKAQMVSPKCP